MNSNNPIVSSVIKDYKDSQKDFLPRFVSIPLSQEAGSNYKPLVKVGDNVHEGDVIAETELTPGKKTYIHSSVPGTVTAIEPIVAPDGRQEFCVKIRFGGAFSFLGKKHSEKTASTLIGAEIPSKLKELGVLNTFKTSIPENLGLQIEKMLEAKRKPENIIVRLFDEDPYRVTDSLISKFYFDQLVKGARILAKAINAKGIVFAIDQKFADKEIFKNEEYKDIKALEMNIRRYPCGTPREIVSAFVRGPLKRTCVFCISKSDLFVDASTAYEVYKAAGLSIPSVDRFVHFSGDCLNASCLLEVKIGITLRELVSHLGGFVKDPAHIIINGMLCGISVQSLDIPITKYVKSVEFLSKKRRTDEQVYSCINCGNCRFVCPVKLSPDILYNHTVNYKLLNERFTASSLACIECGLCNTVCPARLPLCQTIKVLKNKITEE